MEKLHKGQNGPFYIEPKEGQRGLLCSNKKPLRCPSLRLKTKEERIRVIRPVLKNLITRIIEIEISNYINNMYAKK